MKKFYFAFFFCFVSLMAQSQITPPYSYIDINNVSMRVMGDGSNFDVSFLENSCMGHEVPVGSGKATIFAQSLWIAGRDANDSLYVSAMRYRQVGNDFWSGPLRVTDASTDLMTQLKYHHVWNLTREEIEYFKLHYADANYEIPDDILSWPAYGEVGFAENLAPFKDVNGDGHYNPFDGDYPDIKGDQCLFYIFNDNGGVHTESGGGAMGFEIHGMVYAFDAPDDEALNNTVFFNYKIYNRSGNDYHDNYLAVWDDMDCGYGWDDFIGCDVLRSSFFTYNGDEFDDDDYTYGTTGYGLDWPVQVCTILAGPYLDADGRDNPAYDGDCAILQDLEHPLDQYAYNGYGFGNGVVDDERMGMCYATYFNNSTINGDPNSAEGYYATMSNEGLNVRFFYPADSDPCNWGTGCVAPSSDFFATEEEAGNQPNDRRCLGSCGPFTFGAGEVQELDFAQITVFGNETHTQMERKGVFIDHIREFFANQNAK